MDRKDAEVLEFQNLNRLNFQYFYKREISKFPLSFSRVIRILPS